MSMYLRHYNQLEFLCSSVHRPSVHIGSDGIEFDRVEFKSEIYRTESDLISELSGSDRFKIVNPTGP